ncbi:hypothetical protein FACS189426_14870 [Bacteroidia bacterium]|nr:hypothetical protein FACS189426_14870 [Bacteroidia bacterium]
MKKLLTILFILALIFLPSTAQNLRYGLEFNSFEVVQEKRTSLNLTPSKVFSFPTGFSLSFNIFFRPNPAYNFGYVFRIIGQNNRHLDFLTSPDKLTVVDSEDNVLAECTLAETSNNFSLFFPFSIQLDIKNNLLNIVIGEKTFSPPVSSLIDFKKVNIIFGRCNYPPFQTSDVPKIIIKDVRINNLRGDAIYYWKLSKHVEDGVYDELENRFAKAENSQWLLNNHAFWNKKISFKTLKNPQITYNSDEKKIAIADRRNFYTYNTLTHELDYTQNSSGFVHSNQPNQMIYNPLDSTYYSYSFLNTEPRDVAAYNASIQSWNNLGIREFSCEYWHHNRYVSPEENSLYLLGGYGQHKYKNQINKYSFKTGKWERLQYKNNPIFPRYLSGLGVISTNQILLFGGYGSNSGLQSLSPQNYYDLYKVNLPDLTVTKIWEMTPPVDQFVVANSMVVDTLNKCFYALCFPQTRYETSLYLAKFSLQKPGYEIVSNKIPFYFNDILSYVDLFQNKETNELYAITFSSNTADSLATVSVYTLSYPPIAEISTYQSADGADSGFNFLLAVILTLLSVTVIAAYLILKKKKIKTEIKQFSEFTDEEIKVIKQENDRNKKQAIFLFGGFQIKDKNGNDITGEFSPMLKQLFLIILLNTYKENRKGISSTKLDETLWPDKTRDSASNNRSVMTSKIRHLLKNMDNLNIESFNSYWTVKLGNDVYCDYVEALALIRNMKDKSTRSKEDAMKLLNIVSFGELLPNLQIEWVDAFKANFANELIDLLIDVSKQKGFSFSPSELIYLADTLLIYDILNDDALKLKCCALVKLGKNGLAKTTYNSFVKQYQLLFGSKYNYSFDQIIS